MTRRGKTATRAVAAIMMLASASAASADDLEEAKAQFIKSCGTCHSAEPNAPPRQGPNLAGVYGRKAGSLPGYNYSPAMKAWGETWDENLFEPWITNAQLTLPGTYMNYRQADEAKRALIIQYLKTLKAAP